MFPNLKNNAAAGYQGPVKIELLKGAGLLQDRGLIREGVGGGGGKDSFKLRVLIKT